MTSPLEDQNGQDVQPSAADEANANQNPNAPVQGDAETGGVGQFGASNPEDGDVPPEASRESANAEENPDADAAHPLRVEDQPNPGASPQEQPQNVVETEFDTTLDANPGFANQAQRLPE